jgi:nucleoside-diphosphate-sugar epimerase
MPRSTPNDAPVAVVTGGARGIGLAVAERFLAEGHRVALLDIDRKTCARPKRGSPIPSACWPSPAMSPTSGR